MKPTMLMATVIDDHGEDAEPVVLRHIGGEVSMTLDDGTEVVFLRSELEAAVNASAPALSEVA